jgi:putative two-component system response regulator
MSENKFKHSKILIVDDLQTNIDILVELLEMDGYKNIKTTVDSRKVIELIKTYSPDIILLDLIMPKLNGFEVMELIKNEKEKILKYDSYLPILVLTADVSPQTKLKALNAGAKDFLTKPFDFVEVRLRIKNLLETQYLFQLMKEKHKTLEDKVITFLKLNDEWY